MGYPLNFYKMKGNKSMIEKNLKSLYTPLQSLNNIRHSYFHNNGGLEIEYFWFDRIEKSLKALEIIKNKAVNVQRLLEVNSAEEYNLTMSIGCLLKQKEFDLLKEYFQI